MRVAFLLDAETVIECRWSALTGSERYLHNGRGALRLRSFSLTGKRLCELAQYHAAESASSSNREMLVPIDRFMAHGRCGEP